MCIRDSDVAGNFPLIERGGATVGNGSERCSVFGVLQRMTCLLYTSDAADERSSVDLGGRRIIKKKKIMHAGWQT